MERSTSIGVIVVTHNARQHLARCLPAYLNDPLKPRVLVVNSSSLDGTVELAQEMGAETLVVPRVDFNHGTTRELARKQLNCDIVLMVTPDAYPVTPDLVERLSQPIREGNAAVSYARQLPHEGASFLEAFPREFNYPAESQLRGIEDIERYGVYTFFCSNSCAAYNNAALDEVGGFPSCLTGEDTLVAAKLLRAGHKIAYVADAQVKHSHHYSISQEFKRYFDTGLARRQYRDLLDSDRDRSRGQAFLKACCRSVVKEQPLLLPYTLLQTAAKWLGYRVGSHCEKAPTWLKRKLSGQDFYWSSRDFLTLDKKS
jgi:rhamnosyltransferase